MYAQSAVFLGIMSVIVAVALIPAIFYILTLQKALQRCSPESRTTSPGSAWMLLIPLYNIIWQFILVSRIAESLHNEFVKRNIEEDPTPGKAIGIAFCILNILGIIPVVGIVAAACGLVCWIIYWVKIAGYSNKLVQTETAAF
jgi:hypothetical protein